MPVNKPNGRFQLPQLEPVNFSLTEGTNIPPPLASPVTETPPPAPAAEPRSESAEPASVEKHAPKPNGTMTTTNGTAQTQEPLSPTGSNRQGSIRRFLSRNSLSSNYVNGTNTNVSQEDLGRIPRPESSLSFAPSQANKKRSSSWFGRLGSTRNPKRTSVVMEEKPDIQAPPVKMPDRYKLKAKIPVDDGSLGGDDLFKNIK